MVMKKNNINHKAKSKDTKLEFRVRKVLWKRGLRYRKNVSILFGTPDIAFPNLKFVIFIDSCFWHGCPKHFKLPKKNSLFWEKKIERNIERDLEVTKHYTCNGWTILRIWEHDIKSSFEQIIEEVIITHNKLKYAEENKKFSFEASFENSLPFDEEC
ncbi:very short patch repair endonuclease [Exiguobacterium sp. 17-1]|uniref:very short patch repair endonuclease n=1 Tax=Exiguobacterium sp. 17-1 TaxID=2931981 RepID=UPI001FFF0938|nr:very short patch repair endonuclease [Exiguobacterium sp. 17-1]MCK2158632.1 very short patch repair endonuclease [Exiguobacterium sp. 17-1]